MRSMVACVYLAVFLQAVACTSPASPPPDDPLRWVWVRGRIESSDEVLEANQWWIEVCLVEAQSHPCGGTTVTDDRAAFLTFIEVPSYRNTGTVEVWAWTNLSGVQQTRKVAFEGVRFLPVSDGEPRPDTLRAVFTDETIYTGSTGG